MTRIYENRNIWRRSWGLSGFLVVIIFYGIWELYRAAYAPDATTGATFGVLFIGGAIYALYQLYNDYRDVVATLDRDDATGGFVVAIWQPTGPMTLTATASDLGNWRSYVKMVGRTNRQFYVYADLTGYPRPLRFELKPKTDTAGLGAIAPEAVAPFETATGRAKPAA